MPGFLLRIAVAVFALAVLPVSATAVEPLSLQHAVRYTGDEPVTGWLMSEKLDGIRGYWTGKELVSRKGRTIHTPEWFVENFPPFPLDGELWRKRNDFAFVQETVLDQTPSQDWKEITYNIFEVPDSSGTFPDRLNKAAAWFKIHPARHVHIIDQVVCNGPDHLQSFLEKIESLGGEGVIVKNPIPEPHSGRTPDILKVKNFSDMEGVVIAHNPGKGKFSDMMGSLTVQLDNNIRFNLGSGFTLADRRHPPPIGSIVTFKYQGFTHNRIPRFASFLRERKD